MSNSEWNESPYWRKLADYDFLRNLPRMDDLAWEVVRRDQCYRHAFVTLEESLTALGPNWRANDAGYEYLPPREPGESYKKWQRRTMLDDSQERIPLDIVAGRKWGLTNMCSSNASLPMHVSFVRPRLPQRVTTLDDLVPYLDEVVDGDVCVSLVQPHLIAMVFDPSAGVQSACEAITRLYKQSLAGSKAKGGGGAHSGTFIRHLRVLDADRSEPGLSDAEIGGVLGPSHLEHYDDRKKAGQNYRKLARDFAAKGYRSLLTYRGGPKTFWKQL